MSETSCLGQSAIEALISALHENGLKTLTAVSDSERAADLAIQVHANSFAVVRRVHRCLEADFAAATAMVADGDFIWAGLVYAEPDGSETAGLVETFHVSQLDQLVTRLVALREVFNGPR